MGRRKDTEQIEPGDVPVYLRPASPDDGPRATLAKRVHKAMEAKGIEAPALTRAMCNLHGDRHHYGRHRINNILHARHMPEQVVIEDIARVLGVKPFDLLPASARIIDQANTPAVPKSKAGAPSPVRMHMLGGGLMSLTIDGLELPDDTARKVLEVIRPYVK